MPRSPGDRVGRYVVEAWIGEGASGEVYRAHDSVLGRTVALKLLRADASPDAAQRLVREARAAAQVVHANIVMVFDVGEAEGVPFLAMEFLRGHSLREHIAENRVPLDTRVQWLRELADALAAIHKRDLIHRDLKPENIFITEDGTLSLEDGSDFAALQELKHATELDPSFAEAHLRVAVCSLGTTPESADYFAFQKAWGLRMQMNEHDRSVAEIVEPWFRSPPNAKETEQRLDAAIAAHPDDADFAYLHAAFLSRRNLSARAIEACDVGLRRTPNRPALLLLKGFSLAQLGEWAAARSALEQCIAASPSATECWRVRGAEVAANEGDCIGAEDDARHAVALDPNSSDTYLLLANAMASNGAAPEAVADVHRRMIALSPWDDATVAAQLAIWEGNFEEAETFLKERAAPTNSNEDKVTSKIFRARITLALESGDARLANELAEHLLSRWRAWTNVSDPRPFSWCALMHGGSMTTRDFDRQRARWLAERPASQTLWSELGDWFDAFECGVSNTDQAHHALKRLGPEALDWIGSAAGRRFADSAQRLGHFYLSGGEIETAIPLLRYASRACWPIWYVFEHMQATRDLAIALAANGDREGACAADLAVLARWGNAKPRSVTAEAARAHARSLGCAGL